MTALELSKKILKVEDGLYYHLNWVQRKLFAQAIIDAHLLLFNYHPDDGYTPIQEWLKKYTGEQ